MAWTAFLALAYFCKRNLSKKEKREKTNLKTQRNTWCEQNNGEIMTKFSRGDGVSGSSKGALILKANGKVTFWRLSFLRLSV